MTTIELKFPANRFHATPWGRHVNEGVVEWPPSPYRLLRALFDAWKRKHAEIPESEVEELLRALAAEAPLYRLPEVTATHTRSYLHSNTLDPTEKSLIFDGFVTMVPEAPLYVTWPQLVLSEAQSALLNRLLGSLNYLGRSESWVAARLHAGPAATGVPCEPLAGSEASGEILPVACATPAGEYSEKPRWLDAIAYSTAQYQKERRSLPPAMRMVPYVRPEGAVRLRVPKPPRGHAGTRAVVLELRSAVLPLATATIEVAEQVRVRLMGIHKKIVGDASKVSPLFSGKDRNGVPLRDHRHAFILPLANVRGRIDRVMVFTRSAEGFGSEEIQAILRLTELYGRSADDPIRVMATWRGDLDDAKLRRPVQEVISTTPFVATRYWRKGRGTYEEFLEAEVRRECRNHELPEPIRVELLANSPGLFEWVEFRRNRKDDSPRPGYGFRLTFAKAVPAPFSLGYGCHFGLGQFAPPAG